MAGSDCLVIKYMHNGDDGQELAFHVEKHDKYAPRKTGVYSVGLAPLDRNDPT